MAAIVANCAISLNCELTQPVKVQYIDGNMFSMDNAGNTAHVYVFYNGEPQEIVGSVSADVIRSDGTTVAITGAMSGNRAYVIFPQSCYAVPGVVSVVIKVTEGTTVTTIAAFVANVYRSSTDTIVDPGTIIPSVQNLISAIETAVASIPADYSSLWESLAPDYANITFPVTAGKYCTYNGTLYIAKVDIATTESFTAAHWQSTNIGDNLSALKSAIDGAQLYTYGAPSNPNWTIGNFTSSGGFSSYKNTVRTNSAIPAKAGSVISCDSGYKIRVYIYDSNAEPATSHFVSRSDFVQSYTIPQNCYMRMVIGDNTYYNDPTYVLTDTTYSTHVDWSKFVLSNIRQDVTALQSAMPTTLDKLSSGYVDITDRVGWDGRINIAAIGSTQAYTLIDATRWRYLVLPVNSGDKIRVSGQGGGDPRLWAFTDSSNKVLSRSAVFLTETNLLLTASANGYFIFNANQEASVKPKVEIWQNSIVDTVGIVDEHIANHVGFNILSAFTNIMCCGDSLTASVVYTAEEAPGGPYTTRGAYRKYPAVLASRTGANVTYKAQGGKSASGWWADYNSYIQEAENQLGIVYLGTNGGLTDTLDTDAPGDDPANYNASTNTGAYCKIVKAFLTVGAKVLLIHVKKSQNGNGDYVVFLTNSVIDKIAEKFSVAVVDVPMLRDFKYHAYPDGSGSNSLHYNDLGYSAWTDELISCVGRLNETMTLRLIPT